MISNPVTRLIGLSNRDVGRNCGSESHRIKNWFLVLSLGDEGDIK